jgi:hypothetical protein
MVRGVGRYPVFLARRVEKIVRLDPILFVVAQALQHAECANQLQVGEAHFFENFPSGRRFERFIWFNPALGEDKWREVSLSCQREIHALVFLAQHHTTGSDPFLGGWQSAIPRLINHQVLRGHRRILLHTRRDHAGHQPPPNV